MHPGNHVNAGACVILVPVCLQDQHDQHMYSHALRHTYKLNMMSAMLLRFYMCSHQCLYFERTGDPYFREQLD